MPTRKPKADRAIVQFRCPGEIKFQLKTLAQLHRQSLDAFLLEQVIRILEPQIAALKSLEESIKLSMEQGEEEKNE